MFLSPKKRNIFYFFVPVASVLLALFLGIFLCAKTPVYAAETSLPSYLNISTPSASFSDGDTIFLGEDEKLTINLGKPKIDCTQIENGTNQLITNQSDIGDYALAQLETTLALKIDNISIERSELISKGHLKFYNYNYQTKTIGKDGQPVKKPFMYLTLEIDLSSPSFSSGEYVFTFTNFAESSQTDFAFTQDKSFAFTLYIFKTTEYFSSEQAVSQNVTFENVETATPNTLSYRNYYYFNYSNLSASQTNNTKNLLPLLNFDASKFTLSVSKTVAGTKSSAEISIFNSNLVTLATSTQREFLTAVYDDETNKISVIFNDIGEYVLDFKFVFERYNGEKIDLQSNEISNVKQKNDVLYIYGYQMFYGGLINSNNEFKSLSDDKTSTVPTLSADVTYLVERADSKIIKSKNPSVDFESDDQTIRSIIENQNIQPVSTNQPAIILNSNASLNKNLSQIYRPSFDKSTSTWVWGTSENFLNTPITESGTYLLKLVYNYEYYFTNQGLDKATSFAQYFFFTIDNRVPSAFVQDSTGKTITDGAYTKHKTSVLLEGQSPFNSPLKLEIYSKPFASSDFKLVSTINGSTVLESASFETEGNYKVVLLYGKNLSKSKTMVFNIDTTEISGVQILPTSKNSVFGGYEKDSLYPVSFFTSENVAVEWNEKESGAKTTGYFKYIPFIKNPSSVTQLLNSNANGITTTSALNLDSQKIYDKSSFVNAKKQLTSSNIFSSEGFYIIYIIDEAGHEKLTWFCIDRSEIQVLQIDKADASSQKFVTAFDLVSTDKTLSWGKHKLIPITLTTEELATIKDPWINTAFNTIFDPSASVKDNICNYSSKLFLCPEISKVYAKQTGTSLKLITDSQKTSCDITIISQTLSGQQFANEITYSFFFMDESNKLFNEFSAMHQNSASVSDAEKFAENADRNFVITTSTDASNAQILLNSTQNITDVSLLSPTTTSLLQAGFADSNTTSSTLDANLRTKYYFTTGNSLNSKIGILSYRIKLQISDLLNVGLVTMLYYPFVIDPLTNTKVLSQTAQKVVLYDALSPESSSLISLSGEGNDGFYAVNLNVNYDNVTNTYRTLAGKYILTRDYDNSTNIQQHDFLMRESVFIVDREDIVSSPEDINGDSISTVGGGIFVNVLDGAIKGSVQFKNIYSAKNNNTYILQTNKLPVVVYVPTHKYGTFGKDGQGTFFFNQNQTLSHYLKVDGQNLIRYSLKTGETPEDITSYLKLIYFGDSALTQDFETNPQVYKSQDFDLTVSITSSNGTTIQTSVSNLGYITSSAIMTSGIYYVTITQNHLNGKIFPNIYNEFKFSFQIIDAPPSFDFTSEADATNTQIFETDLNGVSYTNENGRVKVFWTDPQDTNYFATVDTEPDQNGYTKIYYYFTSSSGQTLSQRQYLKASDIKMDTSNSRLHYFFIDLDGVLDNSILNVFMQNQRGKVEQSQQTLLSSLTSTTKQLFIDLTAPSQIVDSLISKTTIEGIDLASYTRKFIDLDGSDATSNRFSVPLQSGALAKYAFAVENTDSSPLADLFKTKPANGKFYTEGYYYAISKIANISEYTLPSLTSAISSAKAFSSQVQQTFLNNTYYEITEVDLAGNVAIYLIFVTNSENQTILQFEREKTDIEQKNTINFNEVQPSQNIYAKSFLNVTNIAIHNYAFMAFSLDGEVYFTSSALESGLCYRLSDMTRPTQIPQSISIKSLLSFTAPSKHVLSLNDPILDQVYTFNIYVSNSGLSFSLHSTGEGITIMQPSGLIAQVLDKITISSYDENLDKYVTIYEATAPFNSNTYVSVSKFNSSITFTIISPNLAYSYVFFDNYGIKYIEHHTAGSFVLNDKDKVKNHFDEILISETNNGEQTTNSWFVGNKNIVYNYSSSDYFAYIKIFSLVVNEDNASWEELKLSQVAASPYGIAISDQSNYAITINQILCTISTSPLHQTVKQLVLYAPMQNALDSDFTGGAFKFEITLVSQYDADNSDIVVDRVLINNLTPIIDLKDKNYDSIYAEDAIYSEQLTIVVPSLPTYLTTKEMSPFMMTYKQALVFNQTSSNLNSGTIVEEAGNYEVRIFAEINQNYYLLTSKAFVISEESNAFFEVLVRDYLTGDFISANATGSPYQYNNTICYNHYIVNDEFKLFLNKNQFMEIVSQNFIDNQVSQTTIYEISNFKYAETNNILPYQTTIAVSYIPKIPTIISSFSYTTNDAFDHDLEGTNAFITVVRDDSTDINQITITFNSFYAIKENTITATIILQNQVWTITGQDQETSFTINKSGDYIISFADKAGNQQLFTDPNGIEQSYFYKLRFINGVPYLINGNAPIQNAIYNDNVTISLPRDMTNVYDAGGEPRIVVIKNDEPLEVKPVDGQWVLNQTGYYKVYFNARVKGKELRQESYEFLIMSSQEYKSGFEFSEYASYEISKVIKNNKDFTSSIRLNQDLSSNDAIKQLSLSLYDQKTGQGNYELTILTNSGKNISTENGIVPEQFSFKFIIKQIGVVPITVSISEGESTTDPIIVEFNAYDMFSEIGECKVVYGKDEVHINQEYLDTLGGKYFCSLPITEAGTHFVQVYTASDSLLYSYKVIKTEPLNAVSIILIVAGVLAAAGLTVTVVLLRKKMKIK